MEQNIKTNVNFNELEPVIKIDLEAGIVPMLLGEPGIGKSSFLMDLAQNVFRTKCFTLACNQLADRADLTGGKLVPTENGSYMQVFFPHAKIMEAVEYAETHPTENPILFIDECNRTTSEITTSIMHMVTGREMGNIKLPDNLRLVSAGNDKGSIVPLDSATISRFSLYHVVPDVSTFISVNPTLHPAIKSVLQRKPDLLFCTPTDTVQSEENDEETFYNSCYDEDDMKQFTTPRTITALSDWLNLVDDLTTMLQTGGLFLSIIAKVGETEFASELYNELCNSLSNGNTQGGVIRVSKPSCFDSFVAIGDRTQAVSFAQNMNSNDQSGSLVYMMTQHTDYSMHISALCAANPDIQMTPGDTQALMQAAMSNGLQRSNVQAFKDTNTRTADRLSAILEFNA